MTPRGLHRPGLPRRASPPAPGHPPASTRCRGEPLQSLGRPSSSPPYSQWRWQQLRGQFGGTPLGMPPCKRRRLPGSSVGRFFSCIFCKREGPIFRRNLSARQLSACMHNSVIVPDGIPRMLREAVATVAAQHPGFKSVMRLRPVTENFGCKPNRRPKFLASSDARLSSTAILTCLQKIGVHTKFNGLSLVNL